MNITKYIKKVLLIVLSLCMVISCVNHTSTTVKAIGEEDFESDEDEYVYVWCYPSEMTLTVGQEKRITTEIDDDYNTGNQLIWLSNNPAVADVNADGLVTAKSEGKATITVKYGNSTDKCVVTVKKKTPEYKQVAQKLKSLSKKNKNLKFKNVDVGNICRLYAKEGIVAYYDKKWYSQGYSSGIIFDEYIEIKKKGSGSVAKLVIEGEMMQATYLKSIKFTVSEIKINTSNRRLSFDLDEIKSKSYKSKGVYYGKSRVKTIISSNENKKLSVLKKYNTMLGQKNLSIKFLCEDGAYFRIGKVLKKAKLRKSWKNLNNTYEQILKMY